MGTCYVSDAHESKKRTGNSRNQAEFVFLKVNINVMFYHFVNISVHETVTYLNKLSFLSYRHAA